MRETHNFVSIIGLFGSQFFVLAIPRISPLQEKKNNQGVFSEIVHIAKLNPMPNLIPTI
jgi:hypothetical protein